jgi:hypothetical protein
MSPRNRGGCGGCALALFGLFFGLPLTMLLVAPAIAARLAVSEMPAQLAHLQEWLWCAAGSVPLGVLLVRFSLNRKGRVRRAPLLKRWPGLLLRGAVLVGAMNVVTYLTMKPPAADDHVVEDIMPFLLKAAAAGIAVLVATSWWDRRPRRVTVEEVRAAAAEADRAVRRVRAENDRVRRQASQVQARLRKLQAHSPAGSDVEFHALRVFHRESYQCADTAHIAYQSAQTSLHTMSYLARRARRAPQVFASRRVRAEMRAAATHLAQSQGELRVQVDQGLTVVQTLNANTAGLKHGIRDKCGVQGQEWFEALEERIEQAREERRANR